jgi:hypothetical protein
MTFSRIAAAFVGTSVLFAQEASPPPVKRADLRLVQSVKVIADRIAGIVQAEHPPAVMAVRADDAARAAETRLRAERWIPSAVAAARGRAWADLGFGGGSEPSELASALAADLAGMTLDAEGDRLLVDPQRLQEDVGRGDPDKDADASVLLATGVAPDEPVVGHYAAHVFLDGAAPSAILTTDALLARAALAEGSANLAALVLLFGGVGLESEVVSGAVRPEDVLGGRLVPAAIRQSSPVVANLLEFVYLDGFAQAAALAKGGGFGRLARERSTRRTTRDVVHIDRAATAPAPVEEPVIPGALGLSLADRDSLGEQGVIALVSLVTGKDNLGLIAGDGWIGDSLFRYEAAPGARPAADRGLTVWTSKWATVDDAKDFEYAIDRCLQSRFPGESLQDDTERGGRTLRRPDAIYRLRRDGQSVTFQVCSPSIDQALGSGRKKNGAPSRGTPPKK